MNPVTGDLMGVAGNKNYAVVEWNKKGRVVFSFAQRGNAVTAHFSANKEALRHIKTAINEFCDWVFDELIWCHMVFAMTEKDSVVRIVKKCGFVPLAYADNVKIYMRCRNG